MPRLRASLLGRLALPADEALDRTIGGHHADTVRSTPAKYISISASSTDDSSRR